VRDARGKRICVTGGGKLRKKGKFHTKGERNSYGKTVIKKTDSIKPEY